MPQSPESTSPQPSPTDIIVYFFCKELDHQPAEFVSGRNYECRHCPQGKRENWVYYCSACEATGTSVCHYAAKHINNHVNNVHEGRTVKRRFGANSDQAYRIQEYKLRILNSNKKFAKKSRRGMQRTLALRVGLIEVLGSAKAGRFHQPMDVEESVPSYNISNTNQSSLCDYMKNPAFESPFRTSWVNSEPPKFPIAPRSYVPPIPTPVNISAPTLTTANEASNNAGQSSPTSKLFLVETPSSTQLHHRWARLIYLGSMASLIRFRLRALMEKPHDVTQLLILQTTFNTFLGYAMDIFSDDHLATSQLKNLAMMVTTALSSGENITVQIIEEFRETAEVIQKYLMSKGCGNYLLLGDLLLNSESKVYKNSPRIFLNGMYVTLGLPTSSPEYECEKLFHVLNAWCGKYDVELDNEVLEAIKVNSPKF